MILILMDFVKKDIPLAVLCRAFPYCSKCALYICQNDIICYICECKAGYQAQPCANEITFYSSTYGSTRAITSPTISLSTTEAEPSTQSEESTLSPLLDVPKKSAQVSVVAGSIGGIVLIVLLTIGLVILFRKRTRRHVSDDTETTYTKYNNDIDSNPAYDTLGSPSAENVPTSSKDSGFGKPDESMKADMMDGEYNTLRLHFPVTNERQDNTYNHID
ncbi:uncharacterized protein LOC128237779 [Mya arenaria]|uniref:uncharacterized protein LOC128237779 n=1 Tax=Mya arenaria TaxID=6604 RepID=UPI0022E04DD8|nr:uncharacterized protein LOC128237779 [Mya arenaria]